MLGPKAEKRETEEEMTSRAKIAPARSNSSDFQKKNRPHGSGFSFRLSGSAARRVDETVHPGYTLDVFDARAHKLEVVQIAAEGKALGVLADFKLAHRGLRGEIIFAKGPRDEPFDNRWFRPPFERDEQRRS